MKNVFFGENVPSAARERIRNLRNPLDLFAEGATVYVDGFFSPTLFKKIYDRVGTEGKVIYGGEVMSYGRQ